VTPRRCSRSSGCDESNFLNFTRQRPGRLFPHPHPNANVFVTEGYACGWPRREFDHASRTVRCFGKDVRTFRRLRSGWVDQCASAPFISLVPAAVLRLAAHFGCDLSPPAYASGPNRGGVYLYHQPERHHDHRVSRGRRRRSDSGGNQRASSKPNRRLCIRIFPAKCSDGS